MKLPFLLSTLILTFTSFYWKKESKINGISFVSSNQSITQKNIKPIIALHANYAAIIPFGFNRNLQDPNIQFNSKHQWFGETTNGIIQYSKEFRKGKLKLMMKPQIWVWAGEYSGHIKMKNEKDWKKLEQTYSNFIIHFATLAEELNIEIFCIGTEMESFRANRPKYWLNLIKEIRTKYSGKITYAANWDEYKKVEFWKELDYIGVDAYFPLSNKKTPSEMDCSEGWQKYKSELKDLSSERNKPILFTEFGYTSADSTAMEPWKSNRNKVNLLGQLNATKSIFKEFWSENWFAGGFVWKWYPNHEKSGGHNNPKYTPQNKPAEAWIRQEYSE